MENEDLVQDQDVTIHGIHWLWSLICSRREAWQGYDQHQFITQRVPPTQRLWRLWVWGQVGSRRHSQRLRPTWKDPLGALDSASQPRIAERTPVGSQLAACQILVAPVVKRSRGRTGLIQQLTFTYCATVPILLQGSLPCSHGRDTPAPMIVPSSTSIFNPAQPGVLRI